MRPVLPPSNMPLECTCALTAFDPPGGERDPSLPQLYLAEDHPLHPLSNPGRSFVVKIQLTVAAMEAEVQRERSMQVPLGRDEALRKMGKLTSRAIASMAAQGHSLRRASSSSRIIPQTIQAHSIYVEN